MTKLNIYTNREMVERKMRELDIAAEKATSTLLRFTTKFNSNADPANQPDSLAYATELLKRSFGVHDDLVDIGHLLDVRGLKDLYNECESVALLVDGMNIRYAFPFELVEGTYKIRSQILTNICEDESLYLESDDSIEQFRRAHSFAEELTLQFKAASRHFSYKLQPSPDSITRAIPYIVWNASEAKFCIDGERFYYVFHQKGESSLLKKKRD